MLSGSDALLHFLSNSHGIVRACETPEACFVLTEEYRKRLHDLRLSRESLHKQS